MDKEMIWDILHKLSYKCEKYILNHIADKCAYIYIHIYIKNINKIFFFIIDNFKFHNI